MADDIRRSGRSTKGQHPTKNADEIAEATTVTPKPKTKGKTDKKTPASTPAHLQAQSPAHAPPEGSRPQSAASGEHPQEADNEDDAIYRCVCGDQREIRGREMIMCDRCEAWQHNKCLGLPDSSYWEDKTYLCEVCAPQDHQELLAAIRRGEKPWNRKKGSKGTRPRYRASDVGSLAEGTPETQSQTQTHTPQPTPAPARAPASTTPPDTASIPTAQDPSQAQASAKPSKKTAPKSEPQSPVREKRSHDGATDKEASSSSKRRKSSSQQHAHASPQGTPPASIEALPEKQRLAAEQLMKALAGLIKETSDAGRYRIPEGYTPTSVATEIVLKIEHAAAVHYGAPTDKIHPYMTQFRTIMFNARKNPVLVDRLLHGSLLPEELASMPAEEMASEDKQKEFAAMKEASERQSILIEETGPRLRKTHKGEEIVGEDNMEIERDYKPPEHGTHHSIDDGKPPKPPTPPADSGPIVELPEHIPTQSTPLSVDTSSAQPPNDSIRRPSTNFDINSVFDKVKSPQLDQQAFPRRQSSIKNQQLPQQDAPVRDADIDRLLKDDDNDVDMGNTDETVIWQGILDMATQGSFEAAARFVAGGDLGQFVKWDQLLRAKGEEASSNTLPILGRIEAQRGNAYIEGLSRTSGAYDVGVLAISPVTPEGRAVYDKILDYFHRRDRWGVVPVDKLEHPSVRDLYIIPVEAGGRELPGFLNLLEHCTIETPRPAPIILLALVVKVPDETSNHATPHFDRYPVAEISSGQLSTTGAPAPSPSPHVNPHGPQYSPMQSSFPTSSSFGTSGGPSSSFPSSAPPYQPPTAPMAAPFPNGYSQQPLPPHQNGHPPQPPSIVPTVPPPQAVEIFGPYINDPVCRIILANNTPVSEQQMRNLKHIMDRVPAARMDIGVLASHLAQQGQQGGNPLSGQQPGVTSPTSQG